MSQVSELPFFNFLPLQGLEEEQTPQVNEYFRQIDDSLRWLFDNSAAGGSTLGAAYGNIQSTAQPDLLATSLTEDLVINGGVGIGITLTPGVPNAVVITNTLPSLGWHTFIPLPANPGGADTLWQDDGTNYNAGSLIWGDLSNPMVFGPNFSIGNPGFEQGGINVGGINFNATAKINDFGGTVDAMLVLHRHSTAFGSNLVFARSNTDDDTHAALTAGQAISQQVNVGWSGTHYDIAAFMNVTVPLGTTISPTSLAGEFQFYTTPDLSNTSLLAMIIGSDQYIYGGDAVGAVLKLRGSKDAALGRIRLTAPVDLDWDWTISGDQTGISWSNTINPTGGGVVAMLRNTATMFVNNSLFISGAFVDQSVTEHTVNPGFAVATLFLAQPTYRTTTPGINPIQSFILAAQPGYVNNGAGAATVGNFIAVTAAASIQTQVSGDSLTVTNYTGMQVRGIWSTVSGTTANFGTYRGLQVLTPIKGIFFPGSGVERMAAYYGVDVGNPGLNNGFGTMPAAALRSEIAAGTNKYFLLNASSAQSEFNTGDIHLDDNTYAMFGAGITNPDFIMGWATAQSALVFSTFYGLNSAPLYLRPAATDTWSFQHNTNGLSDVGLGFNVNAVSFGPIDPVPNSSNWFVLFSGPNMRQVQIGGEYNDVLWSASGSIDVNGQTVSDLNAFKINSPAVILNGGTIDDISNLYVAAMPSFGATRTQALRVLGRSRLDGHMNNGSLEPAQITANQNDYQLGANNNQRSMNLLDSDAAYNITGIDSSFGRAQAGDRICLYNVGSFNITLTHQDAASTAANRFITSTGVAYIIGPDECVWLWYDDTGTARWRMLEGTGA